ncbi:hypothetical protein Zmor_005527 [Zophobas morio]|uniref:Uncharacterized protein n=1 Tax=Zophobas morio TaxID=2755281 RepID=A0AA38IT08_9CUCU|nr:hypothetical protein Zmor_005527 [Zophobas morio]
MEFDTIILSALIPAIVVLLTMCLLACLKCGRRKHPSVRRSVPPAPIYTVHTNYNAVNTAPGNPAPSASQTRNFGHHRISSQGDRFAVPLDLLPPNFNFNAPGVEHKGDYVLVKDLKLIQTPSNDEYQKQSPYNPSFA